MDENLEASPDTVDDSSESGESSEVLDDTGATKQGEKKVEIATQDAEAGEEELSKPANISKKLEHTDNS